MFSPNSYFKPDLAIPIDIELVKKPKIKVEFKNKKPVIHLELNLEGDILAIQSRIDYESPDLMPVLNNAVEQYMQEGVDKAIEKCKNLHSDIFNFGCVGAMKFKTIPEWEDYNWNKQFKNADVNVIIDFHINHTGTMQKDSPIISSEGSK
jgi:spore germination protein KC